MDGYPDKLRARQRTSTLSPIPVWSAVLTVLLKDPWGHLFDMDV
jgi:hypothetical protein